MLGYLIRTWLKPFLLILSLTVAVYAIGHLMDLALVDGDGAHNTVYQWVLPSTAANARGLLSSITEFLAGLVGLGITVATILVQLSANRYSSRVVDLFVADRANLAFFTLAIVTPLYTFWVTNVLDHLPWPTSHAFLVLVLVSLNMLLLVPYVNHLFSLLKPEEIITRIRRSVDLSALTRTSPDAAVDEARNNLVTSVNQLTDVILNSIHNSDLNLALRSVVAMRSVVAECVRFKRQAPERWFVVPDEVFLGPAPQQLRRGPSHSCWVEFHAMKQYEQVFFQAVARYPEVTSAIVARTQEIGGVAQKVGDVESLESTILFFNTYLRHSMNARDIRTIFHTFHQYRILAEEILPTCPLDTATRLAQHFRYYGQQCEGMGLGFAIEIAAFDLRRLMEVAFDVRREAVDAMLDVFLEIDREPDDEVVELGQRGVRKSQSILAAFFLDKGREDLARRIQHDMREERLERLKSICDELGAATSKEFWEIQARGANFYYVPDHLKAHLATYFGWFGL